MQTEVYSGPIVKLQDKNKYRVKHNMLNFNLVGYNHELTNMQLCCALLFPPLFSLFASAFNTNLSVICIFICENIACAKTPNIGFVKRLF